MKDKILWFFKHTFWALRLCIATALFVPIIAYIVYFNYTVDNEDLFHSPRSLRTIAELLIDGENLENYDTIDERAVSAVLVELWDEAPNTVAFGSSRILQMTTEVAGTDDFYNMGMVGADFYDIVGTFYNFIKEDKLPENLILAIDPWLFNGDDTASSDERSDKNLYYEFAALELGEDVEYTSETVDYERWKELFSLSYFNENWQYFTVDSYLIEQPDIAPLIEIDINDNEWKCSDGSVWYTSEFRNQSFEQIVTNAMVMSSPILRCDETYTAPSAERMRILQKYIEYIKEQGVNVYILMTPFHKIIMETADYIPENYQGFLATEEAVRYLGEITDVPVYGTYDARLTTGVTQTDFFDGLHCTSYTLNQIWPGIETAKQNLIDGVDPSLSLRTKEDYYLAVAEDASLG